MSTGMQLELGRTPPVTDQQFAKFRRLIQETTGIALSERKQQLLCSRLAPRIRELGLRDLGEYWEVLTERDPHGEELNLLINRITTNKTSFFREAHHFEALAERVLRPAALRPGERRLRLWSAACSSGEEPWTMAMTVADHLPAAASFDVKILATDLDTDVLATAERGIYPADRVEDLPRSTLEKHFQRGTGGHAGHVRVKDSLRKWVTFRRLNFIDPAWPLRAQFDAVFCRNVLIYFDAQLQKRVVDRLLSQLRPGGLLLLGHSESMLGMRPDLVCHGKTIFEKVTP